MNMFSIIQIKSKQYIIRPKLWQDISFFKTGQNKQYILLNRILYLSKLNKFQLGFPYLTKLFIFCHIIQNYKSQRILVLKTKKKKNYKKSRGYINKVTKILIKKEYGA